MPGPLAAALPYAIPAITGLLGGLFGGKKQKQVQQGLTNQYNSAQQNYSPYIAKSQQRSDELYPTIKAGFENMLTQGPPGIGGIESDVQALRDFAGNPIDAYAQSRMRGGGGYENFAETGGYSPQDVQNIRTQNAAIVPSMFSSLGGLLSRQQNIRGRQSPGFTSQQIALARAGGRAAHEANLDADIKLADSIRQGRMWGIGGLTDSESALQNLLTGRKLSALQSATSAGMDLSNMQRSNTLGALQGMMGLGELDENTIRLLGLQSDDTARALQMQANYNPNDSDFFSRFARYSMPFMGMKFGGSGSSAPTSPGQPTGPYGLPFSPTTNILG